MNEAWTIYRRLEQEYGLQPALDGKVYWHIWRWACAEACASPLTRA